MATTNTKPKTRRARPIIGLFVLILVLFGAIFAGTKWSDASWTPNLALDLEGGTQIILQAVTANDEPVSAEDINQAIEIIRQRVDSSGVAETEITSQGGKNIVVAIPGKPSQETLNLVRESAQMQFRPVLFFGAPQVIPAPTPEATPEQEDTPATPVNSSDPAWITPEVMAEFDALDCTDPAKLTGGGGVADPLLPMVTCQDDGARKFILGPMDVPGSEIKRASSTFDTQRGMWVVNIELKPTGTQVFSEVTKRLVTYTPVEYWNPDARPLEPINMFSMVLDNLVIQAPGVNDAITNGMPQISGNYTNETANVVANQLNFGALPLTFEVQSEETISATLGSEQLQKGMLAGLIGLVLVVIYSLIQYRLLGLVTVASLIVAAALTYGAITLLSWTQGYRLSLPGVAGVILAVGITADSFIVYFERIRDELREGRNLEGAVTVGWDRAKRTIIASDTVNFLAAIVLYFLAVGGVRGFAFTLGLTTLIDLVIVFFFTHPIMTILAKTKFFAEGHKWSGFDPEGLGLDRTRYVGRGRISGAGEPATKTANGASGKRLTIAERKAAQEEQNLTAGLLNENPINSKDGDR